MPNAAVVTQDQLRQALLPYRPYDARQDIEHRRLASMLDAVGRVTVTSATAPQLVVRYDASNHLQVSVSSAGAVTLNATGTSPVFSFSDGVIVTAAVGAAGTFRTDTGIEIQRSTDAGLSLFMGENPGSTTYETFIAFGGRDAAGTVKKTSSVSSKWASPTAGTAYGVLRLNATKSGGGTDDVAIRLFGGQGVAIFGSSDTAGPGDKICEVSGRVVASTTTANQCSVRYDGSNRLDVDVSSAGAVTFDAVGASASFAFSDYVAINAGSTSGAFAVTSTGSNQAVFKYDGSNYVSVNVSSAGAVTFDAVGASAGFTFSDDVNMASGKVYKVNGTQVVSAQGAAIADASGGATIDAEARTAINTLLARLRTHGLISS